MEVPSCDAADLEIVVLPSLLDGVRMPYKFKGRMAHSNAL